jgi:hypothetical protein
LESELLLGNEVVETAEGWPHDDTIIIFLKKPFGRNYKDEKLNFREVNDPHYWKSEYLDKATHHIIVCKFG